MSISTSPSMSTATVNDFDDVYGSKYFSAADLHGEAIRRKIGKIEIADLREKDGSTKRKFVVYFKGVDKPLVLNRTNAQKLAAALGKDPAAWVGIVVELYPEMTSLGKEGVRLRVVRAAGAGAGDDMNDSIGF
jgi:hypothetical protein